MTTAVANGTRFAESATSSSEASVSHSREKVNLCCEIILDHFGAVEAQVACTLLQRGRLTLRELSRFLATPTLHAPTGYVPELDDVTQEEPHQAIEGLGGAGVASAVASTSATSWSTPLRSQRLIQFALLTLIQHNLCWHTQSMPDGTPVLPSSNDSSATEDGFRVGMEYFQINVDEVLPRLRFGEYRKIAQDCFGNAGEAIISEILKHGKRRVSDVIAGVHAQHPDFTQGEIEDTLRDLLFYAYIQPSSAKSHVSSRDRHIAYEMDLISRERRMLGPKERKSIAGKANSKVAEDDRQIWFSSSPDDNPARRGLHARVSRKRSANGTAANGRASGGVTSKKAKANDGKARKSVLLVHSSDEEDAHSDASHKRQNLAVDPTLFVRANFDRFDVHIRNELLVRSVASRYNTQLASLVQVMLQYDRGSYERIVSARDKHSCAIRVSRLRQQMSGRQLGLCDALDEKQVRKKHGADASTSDSALLGDALALMLASDDWSPSGQAKNFIGPAAEARTNVHLGGFSQVQVQYRDATRIMRQQILRNVVESQFGTSGTRVVSVLRELGKLDEKQISKVCLITMSDTRDVCARLFAAGLLSLQEVPKSSERLAARSFFFWYLDERKCFAWLSDRLCKTLARLAQRKRHELTREAGLLAKVQQRSNDDALAEGGGGGGGNHALLQVERIRLQHVRDTVNLITLAETKIWRDLFITSHLPE